MEYLISGAVAPGFEPVREAFLELWDEVEIGAGLCVMIQGEPVIDLIGGYVDRARQRPWQQDSLVNIYSTGKGIVTMAIACLIEEGRINHENPVAEYWPAFGDSQKAGISVRDVMAHRSGIFTFDPQILPEDLYHWSIPVANIAQQHPAWQPGKAFGYHAITWGFIVGEIIRRVTGISPGQYIRERITSRLQAAVYLGLEEKDISRCAELIGPNHARKRFAARPVTKTTTLVSKDPVLTPFRHISSDAWRTAEIPASNMHATAKGLARCYDAFINDRLVSRSTREDIVSEVTRGETDLVLGRTVRRSSGFILNCDDCYSGPLATSFGHSGTGGSVAFADPKNNLSFAYVMNQLHPDGKSRYASLVDTTYDCYRQYRGF